MAKESRKKKVFLCGQSTKAPPPPLGLVDKRTFFRLKKAGNGFWHFFLHNSWSKKMIPLWKPFIHDSRTNFHQAFGQLKS